MDNVSSRFTSMCVCQLMVSSRKHKVTVVYHQSGDIFGINDKSYELLLAINKQRQGLNGCLCS